MELEPNDAELDLESILNEFRDQPTEETTPQPEAEPASTAAPVSDTKVMPALTLTQTEPTPPETEASAEVHAAQPLEPTAEPTKTLPVKPAAELTRDTIEWEGSEAPVQAESLLSSDTMAWAEGTLPESADTKSLPNTAAKADTARFGAAAPEQTADAAAEARSRLQLLKKKLIAGPEKRYYDLSEQGVGRLQLAIVINLAVVLLCIASAVMFSMGLVPENRMRFMIFSQVLAMLVSAFLGSGQIVSSIVDLFKGKFTVNTLMTVTLFACMADAVMCFQELRVPCCAAFAMEMTFSMLGSYFTRCTEMSQMDTLRKASKLIGLSKCSNFYDGKSAILRREGDLDDFWETYRDSSTPQKLQSFYAFFALIFSLGAAAMAAMFHGPSLAVQVLACTLLISVPAGAFIALTRPPHLLEKRLHMVGTVLCGWSGVRQLRGKAMFPVYDSDLFPAATTKLNGVKFLGQRKPDDIIAYTASVICEAGGGLSGLFENMMRTRSISAQPVLNLQFLEGGIAAEVRGEQVLVGNQDFMKANGVEFPEGSTVSQAVYAAVSGRLAAVYAISYAKMRSATAGMVSLVGCRKLNPVMLSQDFMLTESFVQEKFQVKTKRILFPSVAVRQQMLQLQPDPAADVLALTTRSELISSVYAVSGANVLASTCRIGLLVSLMGGSIGLLIMLALAFIGEASLLTPLNVMIYELVWLVPCWLISSWTKTV